MHEWSLRDKENVSDSFSREEIKVHAFALHSGKEQGALVWEECSLQKDDGVVCLQRVTLVEAV